MDSQVIPNEDLQSLSLQQKIGFIANVSQQIVMDPERNISHCHSLLRLLKDPSFLIIKLSAVSMAEILINVAPLYKVDIEQTNEQLGKMIKKEDRRLLQFEAELLQFFEKYFKVLQSIKEALSHLIRG